MLGVPAGLSRFTRRGPGPFQDIESDDLFQRGRYEGDYDADERAVVFSLHAQAREVWLQFALDEARAIESGRQDSVLARPAES